MENSKLQSEPDAGWTWEDEDRIYSDAMILKDGDPDDRPQDLEERTALFGEAVIRLCKRVPRNPINDRLVGQLTGASTGVGANYCEANEGVSKKDFRYSVSRSKKEAKKPGLSSGCSRHRSPTSQMTQENSTAKPPSCCSYSAPCIENEKSPNQCLPLELEI